MRARIGKQERAFTLTELMIIVGVLSVVVTLSAADFTKWIRRTRFNEMTRSIFNGLLVGRAEAIRRGGAITCSLGPELFVVFVDKDGNGKYDKSDEKVVSYPTGNNWFALRTSYERESYRSGMRVEAPAGNYIIFNSLGYSIDRSTSELRELVFAVVDDELERRKNFDVSVSGAVRMRK
tara:strand:+ start:319 stop:855 length:537 start_codon:yes stop_codon:yes gene_type:complete